MRKSLINIAFILLLFLPSVLSKAQGFQTQFGKNKVQYEKFEWTFYRDKEFEVYYHQNGRNLAQYLMSHAHDLLVEVEAVLDYKTDQRIVFVIYNTYSDYLQSNIKLIEESYNTGGMTPILDNIAFVYFDGNHLNFDRRIKAALTEVLINELMYGTSVQERFQNSALISLPDWYYKGLISYVSKDWDLIKQEQLDKGIKSEHFKRFGRLDNYDRVLLGYSFWNYIDKSYGKNAISNILYITHVYKSLESGFNFVLGKSFNTLYKEWYDYYSLELMDRKHNFDDINEPFKLKKIKKNVEVTHLKFSPDGRKIAYVTNKLGKTKLWIYDIEKKKYKKILTRGYIRPNAEKDKTYPLIDWHPRENILSVIYDKKTKIRFFDYNLDKKKRENKKNDLDYIEKILDFKYDYTGRRVAMSAIKNGFSDIIQFEIKSNRFFPVTNDIYDDLNPVFTNDSKGIIFSSNRTNDTLSRKKVPANTPFMKSFDLFYYNNFTRDDKLINLTNTPVINELQPLVYDSMYYSYIIDENLIINRSAVRLDSIFKYNRVVVNYQNTERFPSDTFLFPEFDKSLIKTDTSKYKDTNIFSIDTNSVYKAISYNYSLTNYPTNIHLYSISQKRKKILEAFNKGGKYLFSISNYPDSFPAIDQKRTFNKDIGNNYEKQVREESGLGYNTTIKPSKDTKGISSDNTKPVTNKTIEADTVQYKYKFINDFALINKDTNKISNQTYDSIVQKQTNPELNALDKEKQLYGHASSYFLSFIPDYIDFQFDNSYMGSPYLTYDGTQPIYPFFNVVNLMMKVGLNDLFKDHRIVAAFRPKLDFSGAEYLFSLENVKKRMDKKITFYRKGETTNEISYSIKQLNYELRFQIKYPFTEYSSLKFEMFGRVDRKITLPYEKSSLRIPDVVTNWVGGKTEYVFDNAISLGLNLYQGTKAKLYFEYFTNLNDRSNQFSVIGGDYRKYIRIHKQIIWANRIAFATSFGDSKIVYFMGGEDNWLFPTINNQIQVDPEINYVYKSTATNMRGFYQNIRNGNSYAVINSELRIPVIKYFTNRPLKSAFFENFQLISFADVGTAWTGSNPYSNDNSLYKRVIFNGPLKITVISVGEPIVSGYGFGFRTTVLGYFLRVDRGYGFEAGKNISKVTYLSLGFDF